MFRYLIEYKFSFIQKIVYAILRGTFDSIKGMYTVVYLDTEINTRNSLRQSPTRTNSIVRQKNSQDPPVRSLKKHE